MKSSETPATPAMKYNPDGIWKPLVYAGDSDSLQAQARKATTDPRIQGILFYIYCTGHKVIEFAIRASIRLPLEKLDLPNDIHLIHVPQGSSLPQIQNEFVYDAWAGLKDDNIETIRDGLLEINRTINRLGFAYSCEARWQLKYTLYNSTHGAATPDERDMQLLSALLGSQHQEEALKFLDAAVDWYRRGRAADNAFNQFLCYWIALEGLALSIYDGCLGKTCPYGFGGGSKEAEEAQKLDCIRKFQAEYLASDPRRFVATAYSECIRGIRRRSRACLEKVLGPESRLLKSIFEKSGGVSLEDIRHRIAHGEYSGWDFKDEDLVVRHVGILAIIVREFLLRVLLKLRPDQAVPAWSGLHAASMIMSDPRSTLVVSDLRMVGSHDWTIQASWID